MADKLVTKVSALAATSAVSLVTSAYSAIDCVIAHVRGTTAVNIIHDGQTLSVGPDDVGILSVIDIAEVIQYQRVSADSAVDIYIVGDAV
jgi:hypothetical protein